MSPWDWVCLLKPVKYQEFTRSSGLSSETHFAGDGERVAHFVGAQLQSDLLVILVLDPRLLGGNNHVQQDVAHPGGGRGKVHPALVGPLVQGRDVVQDQSARVAVSPEEGSTLQNAIVRPVAGTQIAFPYRAREERIDDSFRLILN